MLDWKPSRPALLDDIENGSYRAQLRAEGKLPAYLIGDKLVKFDPADLDHFLASNRIDNS